jgi:hypothetical protein
MYTCLVFFFPMDVFKMSAIMSLRDFKTVERWGGKVDKWELRTWWDSTYNFPQVDKSLVDLMANKQHIDAGF